MPTGLRGVCGEQAASAERAQRAMPAKLPVLDEQANASAHGRAQREACGLAMPEVRCRVGAIRSTVREVRAMTLCLTQLEEQAKACSRGVKGEGWTLEVPIRIQNGCNLREHWGVRAKRVRYERASVSWAFVSRFSRHAKPPLPAVVTITRLAPRKLDDDNAIAGMKGVRDAVADCLGVLDNDPRVTWRYAQEKAKAYACRIAIEEVGK
jgi:hypothetical protein